MSYENIWEKGGVYRKYSNHVTGEEVFQAVQDVYGHAQFDSIHYVINDFLDVTNHDEVSHKDLKSLAAIDKAAAISNPNIKIAIVATLSTIQKMASTYGELMT